MDDQILCIPECLASAARTFSEKALQVLSIHSDLDGISQTLHDSLPNVKAQLSIDNFWSKWSKLLLSMASEIESIALLLANAAIAYLNSDEAIMKAFHADKAAQDAINYDLGQVKTDKDNFDNTFNQEKQADGAVNAQKQQDQKKSDDEDDAYFAHQVDSQVQP